MKRFFLAAAVLGTGAITGAAQAQSDAALAMAAVIEGQGCSISLADADPSIFASVGSGTAELEAAFNELLSLGLAQFQGDTVAVTTGACADQVAASAAPELMVSTLRALRDMGCGVTEDEMIGFLAGLGPREEVMAHLRDLQAAEFVVMAGEARGMLLDTRLCTAPDAGLASFAAQVPEFTAMEPVNRPNFEGSPLGAAILMTERAVSEGCSVPNEVEREMVRALEIVVFDVAIPLVEAGLLIDGVPGFNLAPGFCAEPAPERRDMLRGIFADE